MEKDSFSSDQKSDNNSQILREILNRLNQIEIRIGYIEKMCYQRPMFETNIFGSSSWRTDSESFFSPRHPILRGWNGIPNPDPNTIPRPPKEWLDEIYNFPENGTNQYLQDKEDGL